MYTVTIKTPTGVQVQRHEYKKYNLARIAYNGLSSIRTEVPSILILAKDDTILRKYRLNSDWTGEREQVINDKRGQHGKQKDNPGGPLKYGEQTHRLSLRVPDSLLCKIDEIVKERDTSRSEVVVQALNKTLK